MDRREEAFRARGSSAVRIDREEAGRYGEREAWIKERIGASRRVRSEPIARKHVREAARIVGSENTAHITSENGRGSAEAG